MFTPRDLILGIDVIFFLVGLLLFISAVASKREEKSDGPQAYIGGITMFVAGMLWLL